ncbi:MAG TPA: hypothetical protein VGK83_08695, partial [Acidimicrobiia bacterium]
MSSATGRVAPSLLSLGLTVVLASCGQAAESPPAPQPRVTSTIASTTASPNPTSEAGSATTIQNILDLPHFVPLEANTYYIDPDNNPSTPLRVMYTISEEGWLQWIGTFKPEEADGEDRFVGVSIATVSNLMADACVDQRPADPPIGPTVDDLAAALAELPPFQVTKPPSDVTNYGYSGKHLELTVPDDIPFEIRFGDGYFTDCGRGELQSWIVPGGFDYFYGYEGPGQVEEFTILDIDGSRLMIQATWFPE